MQLTWWKIVNIHSFSCLRNEYVLCICKQLIDRISDLQGVQFSSYLLLDFFIFLSFWMVFPPVTCFRLLFLRKAIIGLTEKVFSKVLVVLKKDQTFRIIWFLLESVRLYVTISGNTWVFCVAFNVRRSSLFVERSLLTRNFWLYGIPFLSDTGWSGFTWR